MHFAMADVQFCNAVRYALSIDMMARYQAKGHAWMTS